MKVTLAGEDTRVLRQNVCGTVLVTNDGSDRIQPIVPMGALVEDLGCSLQWHRGALKLRHPTKGFIKVYLNNNCPEVNFREAHRLIKELESKHLAQLSSQVSSLTARLEVLRKEEKRTWMEMMKEYVNTGCQATLLRGRTPGVKRPFQCNCQGRENDPRGRFEGLEALGYEPQRRYMPYPPMGSLERESHRRDWISSSLYVAYFNGTDKGTRVLSTENYDLTLWTKPSSTSTTASGGSRNRLPNQAADPLDCCYG